MIRTHVPFSSQTRAHVILYFSMVSSCSCWPSLSSDLVAKFVGKLARQDNKSIVLVTELNRNFCTTSIQTWMEEGLDIKILEISAEIVSNSSKCESFKSDDQIKRSNEGPRSNLVLICVKDINLQRALSVMKTFVIKCHLMTHLGLFNHRNILLFIAKKFQSCYEKVLKAL